MPSALGPHEAYYEISVHVVVVADDPNEAVRHLAACLRSEPEIVEVSTGPAREVRRNG